ncbi:MAG: hypothetical protein MI748_02100 [Opitutales bacterium]|nr:hypothetical protein [Opitutales bacterium]
MDKSFRKNKKEEIEDWGELSSIRIWYSDCVEVEFGIVSPEWVKVPSDEGTSRVVNDGMKILYDPEGDLEKLNYHCNKKIQNKAGIGITTSSAVRNPSTRRYEN